MSFVQTCDVDEKEVSYFLTSVDDRTITKSLYNANGKCGDVGVSSTGSYVTKCHFSTTGTPAPVSFHAGQDKKAVVVDIDAICFKKDSYGIVVALNTPVNDDDGPSTSRDYDDGFTTKKDKAAREPSGPRHYNPVMLYVENYLNEFKLQRNIKVYGEISCMRVLISPSEMPSQRPFLSAKIATWQNVVAIGCERSSCFLGQFAEFDPDNVEHWDADRVIEVAATTDALKSLVTEGGRFGYLDRYFMKDEASVTAVSYIPCYAVVVVGLSNGGIVMIPLDGKSCIACLTIPYATPIDFLVVLEPEFDPAGGFYVFSARQRPQGDKHKTGVLGVFSHKIQREADGDGGFQYRDMNSVMITLRDGAYWLNVHGVVKRRKRREADASNDASTLDNSQLPEGLNTTQHMYSDGMERTLMFYSYIDLKGDMKGGLFDLNAFYSIRCATQQVRFDEYDQDPICSRFSLTIPRRTTGEILFRAKDISWVHCQNTTRYKSPLFNREPLFQPQALALSLTIHIAGRCAFAATVDSLQYTALDRIGRSLSMSLAQPDFPLALLERTGLILAPTTKRERLRMEERPATDRVPSELDKILRAIVSEAHVWKDLRRLIEETTDRKQLLHVGRWMFNELRDMIVRMDESMAPLFDGVSPEMLSKDAQEIMAFCPDFFEFAERVFWNVRTRGALLANDTPRLRFVRKMHALMAFDLRLFHAAVKWFTRKLPMCEGWTTDLMDEVAEINTERSQKARRERNPLFLDALLMRLHEKTMEDCLWRGLTDPVQWYPPTRFHLLSLLRQTDSVLADRTALVLYYLMDVDEVVRRDGERPEDQKRGYPVKESLVRSFIIWEAGKLMDGQQAVDDVRERWERDMKGGQKENRDKTRAVAQVAGQSRLSDAEKEELRTLLKAAEAFRKLQRVDEDRMKVLWNKQDFGIYRWHLFLIKKGRYPEVEDLPVPGPNEPFPHRIVQEYAKYKALALAQKAGLPPPTRSNAFACPYTITKPVAKPENSPDVTSTNHSRIMKTGNITIRGKTPKKLNIFRRVTTGAAGVPVAGPSSNLLSTPSSRTAKAGESSAETARINALLKTPSMRFRNQQDTVDEEDEGNENNSNVAPDEMARVRDALRTPRSRAATTTTGEGTPEGARTTTMIVPTSILKSALKESRLPQSVSKSRLRFAKVFEEKSISPRERDHSVSSIASMSQPNFDDSFDDEHVLSKSSVGSSTGDAHNTTTRLEREIEEEELIARRRATEEMHEASMESGDLPPLSSGEEEEGEELTEENEEMMEEEEEGGTAEGSDAFQIYHDSEGTASTDDEAEKAFVDDDDSTAAAVAAGDQTAPKTPPPTPDEEETPPPAAVAVAAVDDGEEEDGTPEEREESDRSIIDLRESREGGGDEHFRPVTPVLAEEEEEEEEAPAAPATPPTPAAASNETFTVSAANATFIIDLRESREGGEEVAAAVVAAAGVEEEEEEEAADDAAWEQNEEAVAAAAAVKTPSEERMEEEEEEAVEPNLSCAATPLNEEEEEEDEETLTPAEVVAVEEEKEEEEEEWETPPPAAVAAVADAVAVDEEKEEAEEGANVSRPSTPVDDVEEEEKMAEEPVEVQPEVVEQEEEEEEEVAVAASERPPPPRPKQRTVFSNRAEPISLGLRSYIYMEGGVEKSFEEQRDDSTDGEEEQGEPAGKQILASLTPAGRRSGRSSRLQQRGGGEGEETTEAASATRKRGVSRSRKDSEKDVAGPSSPRGKKERREGDEEEEEGHLHTTTRTRVVEERYVQREDGVLQHTVKQSTKVIEMTDGVVVKDEREDREMIEEEGDKAESLDDEADRATPPMVEAAAEPTTGRRSSRTAVTSRSRTQSTTSKKDEEAEKKKREEKETTPLRSPVKSARGRNLSKEEDESEKKQEEPLTPRRSTRARKPSESAGSIASQTLTPLKSARKNAPRAAKTPSREPSAVPASPRRRLQLDDPIDEETEKKKTEDDTVAKVTVPTTPGKRGRPRKESIEDGAAAAVAAPPVPAKRTTAPKKSTVPTTPSKRGRPRKEPIEDAAAAAAEVADPTPAPPVKRRTTLPAAIARKRAASESMSKEKEQAVEEEEEDGDDPIAALRKLRDKTRAEAVERRKTKEMKSRRTTKLGVIPEDTVAKVDERKKKKVEREEDEDLPSTSQASAPAGRKRSLSEAAVQKTEKETIMKTPSKKKARATEKDDEEEGEGDQSILRRSSRKAAVSANDALKTPLRRGKQ